MNAFDPSFPATLFGVPRGLDPEELTELEDFLQEAWRAQHGRDPSTLAADIERLRDIFKTGASAKKLRDLVATLPSLKRRPPSASDEVFVAVDDRRGLVTPEGRALLAQLQLMREHGGQVIARDAMLQATAVVADAYGGWQREWLGRQLGTASLRPGTYGVVVLLLLNGSVSRETALRLPSSSEQERTLAQTVLPIIDAFATRIGGQPVRGRESERLRSNWRLTEARRHLFERIRVEDEGGDAYVWIDGEGQTIELLAERLSARSELDVDALANALQAAANEYAAARPRLAAWGVAHDRASHTRHVVESLESGFVRERSAP